MVDEEIPTVRVFTAEDCGRCPAVVDLVRTVTADRRLEVEILDVEDDRTAALRAGVLSVPTVVVGNEQLRGVPARKRLEAALESLETQERPPES